MHVELLLVLIGAILLHHACQGGLFSRILGKLRTTGQVERLGDSYNGLVNLGNTCYMNSVLQSLYYVKDFRDAVMTASYINGSVGRELQTIFTNLEISNGQRPVNTIGLSRCLGLNVNIQEDSQEFFLKLLNKLSEGLESAANTNPASVFEGEFEQNIEFTQGNFQSRKIQPFKDISTSVDGQTSLVISLEDLFQSETLEGYIVPGYGVQSVEKNLRIHKLPNALCVHLKRFEFDTSHMRMMKVGQFFEFPLNLDLASFAGDEESTFQLSSVVIHDGTSNVGHYICFARPNIHYGTKDRWIKLNDRIVSEVSMDEVCRDAFGGFERQSGVDFSSKNAYLLFYSRKVPQLTKEHNQ